MSWTISYASSVERDIQRLPLSIRNEFTSVIEDLRKTPYLAGFKKLKGARDRYRIRIGHDYRLVYSVYKSEHLIDIEFIGHRKDAYRWF